MSRKIKALALLRAIIYKLTLFLLNVRRARAEKCAHYITIWTRVETKQDADKKDRGFIW